MKKLVLSLIVVTIAIISSFAEVPDYFAFEIGSGASLEVGDGEIAGSSLVGFSYSFNETIGGGFTFTKVGDISINTVNISYTPVKDTTITMYTGQVGDLLGFGAGLGYDFFTKKKGFFTSLGIYLNWYASNGSTIAAGATTTEADVAEGGLLTMGLKTRIGL
ncbi:MAG: hypothetical protein OCD02_16680 [Spirochaetaceae bacterium]